MLRVLDNVLTYEVDQILIVEPQETGALRIEEGKDYCTLVTCTPYGINTHRLLVRGRRITSADLPANAPSTACTSFTPVSDAFSNASFSSISDTFAFFWRFTIGLGIFSAITGITFLLYIWKICVNSEHKTAARK